MAEEGSNLVRLDDFEGEIDEYWFEVIETSVLDANGDEVGTVEELYVWEEASTVHLIKVSGEEGSFLIPVHAATNVDEDGVKLETSGGTITSAPEHDSDEVPDEETRSATFKHYGYPDPLDVGGS